jgi:uncharacterized membrane protein
VAQNAFREVLVMITLPPIPSWEGLHPLIIHFPIVLLLISPFLILIGAFLPREKGRALLYTALGLMVVGTLSTFLAAATGEAAAKLVERTPQINAVLEQHEELADLTRGVFLFLTVIFAAIILAPKAFHKLSGRLVETALPLIFLVLYGVGAVLLTNTAHNGGRLVHEFGVRAMVVQSPAPVQDMATRGRTHNADQD